MDDARAMRFRAYLAVAGVVMLAAGIVVGTRPAADLHQVGVGGFEYRVDCGIRFWPRCEGYGWAEVATAVLMSGGVALVATAFACWVTGRRAGKPVVSNSIRPAEGLSTSSALLFIGLPLFVTCMLVAAVLYNLVRRWPVGAPWSPVLGG
jgi:hypothetical protein